MTQRVNFGLYVPATNAMVLHKGEPPRQMAADRTCAAHGCDTVLSIYNKGTECSVHEPLRPAFARGIRKVRHGG